MRPATAARLMSEPEFDGLFDELRQEYLEEFGRTPLTQTDTMVRIRMQIQCLESLKGRIESLAHDHRT